MAIDTPADGSFSFSGTEIIGSNSGAGSGTLTVSYVDPTLDDCGAAELTIDGSIGVTVDQCFDYCFILRIKSGGETHIHTYDTIVPDTVYSIIEDYPSASKFQFMINCPQGTVDYNYYRGFQCGADWKSGESTTSLPIPLSDPPSWITGEVINGEFYPANINQGLKLCQHGGNILKIQVTKSDNTISVFTFTIDRTSQ